MIEIRNLCKSFKDKEVLRDLNLKIKDGEVFGLVGINGAGKSTLLRLISGIYEADSGYVLVDDVDAYENEDVKRHFFFLHDEPYYGTNTTPKSLLEIYKAFYPLDVNRYFYYLNFFKLPIDKKMNNFSKGMKRQVFISLALAIKPKYLLLDEAFDGLDPLARLACKRAIIDLVEEKQSTVIISSHSLRELEDICDSYGLLDNKVISSSGDIVEATSSIHKYQVAFEVLPNIEELGIEIKKYSIDGRIVKIFTKLEYEEFSLKLAPFNPLIIDEIAIDFEELFILEVESRGYLKWENTLYFE